MKCFMNFIALNATKGVEILTKAQREKAERLLLKQMLDTNPKLKQVIDGLIECPNPELKDIIQPVIEEKLKESRGIGVNIGWQAAFIQTYEKVKDMETADEIKACLRGEADAIRERMGLKSAFDEDGNVVVESDEE